MAVIKSLDENTIHRICSGQVIINLANAVKELIENSLDAGSKTVEIRLKQYGSDSIEVIDDGPGIEEADFQTITLKHYTSKIQKYDDLETLGTFGFRGEALSSLCALSDLKIITRHRSATAATKLEYDKKGLIVSKTACARSVGTSVILERLFHSLPVRHKEFTKNLKREYHKLIHVIQCYCLISEGIKLSCYNTLGEKATKVMSTHSKNSLKDNIIEIFGLSTMNNLVRFEQAEPTDDVLIEFKLIKDERKKASEPSESPSSSANSSDAESGEGTRTNYKSIFQIEGFVSECTYNCGRSAPDRQYIYVNKRPCDHSRITKLINEVFHQYNRTQYPMFIINITMNCHDVDVNVTPDKLQMFIKNESALLASIKASLLKMYNRSFKNMSVESNSLNNSKSSSQLINSFFSPSTSAGTKKKFSQMAEEEEEADEEPAAGPRAAAREETRKRSKLNDDDQEDERRAEEGRSRALEVQQADLAREREVKRLRESENVQIYESIESRATRPGHVSVQAESPKRNLANQAKITSCFPTVPSPQKATGSKPPAPSMFTFHKLGAAEKDKPTSSPSSSNGSWTGRPFSSSAESCSPKTPKSLVLDNPLKLFQTRIGSNTHVDSLNDSISERIDLHGAGGRCLIGTSPLQKPTRHNEPGGGGKSSNADIFDSSNVDHDSSFSYQLKAWTAENEKNKISSSNSSTTSSELVIQTPPAAGRRDNLDESSSSQASSQSSINLTQSIPVNQSSLLVFGGAPSSNASTISSSNKSTLSQENGSQKIPSTIDQIAARKEKVLKFDYDEYMRIQKERAEKLSQSSQEGGNGQNEKDLINKLKFKTKNLESKDAEAELDRSIAKEDFLRMKICGQFNKGFIITQLDQDLFIVDQHAADEIYNFEQLQRTGKIEKQRLLQPHYLELTASSEAVLLDNVHLLEKAGYEMQVISNRKVGNRIMITSVPISNKSNKLFNLKDIDELLFILSENELNPGSISTSSCEQRHLTDLKPSSLRALYASKACRKSVMIGDSLNMNEMRRVVSHLSEIDKPWNCPHGRPTLRHLLNVDLLRKFNTES